MGNEIKISSAISSLVSMDSDDRRSQFRIYEKAFIEKFGIKNDGYISNALSVLSNLHSMLATNNDKKIDEIIKNYFELKHFISVDPDMVANLRDVYMRIVKAMAAMNGKDARYDRAEKLKVFLGGDNLFTALLLGSLIKDDMSVIGNPCFYSTNYDMLVRIAFPISKVCAKKRGDLAIYEITVHFDEEFLDSTIEAVDIIGIDNNYTKKQEIELIDNESSFMSHLSITNPNQPTLNIHMSPYHMC